MGLLSVEELKTLAEQNFDLCVSIFMPIYRAGAESQQNPIRFKNLIRQAEAQIQESDRRSDDASDFLQPARNLDQEDFWQQQDQGLAIFIADGFLRYYPSPISFDELVVVSDRFHLKPLMPLLTEDSDFYVLALSQHQVRFFTASRYSIHEVEVEGMPQGIEEALQYDETAKDAQFRISTSKGGTNNSFQHAGTFHGQGSPDQDDAKADILQYFFLVDRALHPILRDQKAPLVLVAVDYLLPIYREANSYQHLLDEGVIENPKVLKPAELHERVLPIVEPFFVQSEQAAIGHYREMTSTGKTSTDIKEAVPAAYYGRVEQLFVAVGMQQWGNFDPQANELQIHADAEPGDEDLLNAAAVQTLLNGGKVYAVPPEEVPDAAPLAAVFRY